MENPDELEEFRKEMEGRVSILRGLFAEFGFNYAELLEIGEIEFSTPPQMSFKERGNIISYQ
jgi:hypothetical protein